MSHPLTVSVVVPARNEASHIEAALASILSQDVPGLTEIVVADGMSDDETRAIVQRIAVEDPRVRLIDNPTGATPTALNLAIEATTGDVIVRCDGHVELPAGYIARSLEIMAETGADNVGGMQVAVGDTRLQRGIALAMSIPLGVGDARFHLGGPPGPVDTVFLGVFKRSMLQQVGLFDEGLLRNQDSELNYRIRSAGGLVYFHPDLRVRYFPRASLRGLWRQYFGSGAWKRETFRRSPGAIRWRQLVPPALVLGLLASVILIATPARRLALAVPALYAVALLFATVWTGLRRRTADAVLLPIVLPIMHIGWGLGFFVGRARRPTGAASPRARRM